MKRKKKSSAGDGGGAEKEVVKVILGAHRVVEDHEAEADAPPPSSTAALPLPTSSSSILRKQAQRPSEPFQLLRPKTDARDFANVRAVNVLDAANFNELARDVSPVEKALLGSNTTFRVIGALGGSSANLERASLLTDIAQQQHVFSHNSNNTGAGLEIFVQGERRIFLLNFPALTACGSSSNSSQQQQRKYDTPIFVQERVDPARYYDLRIALTALTTCQVLLLVVKDDGEEKAMRNLLRLVRAAMRIRRAMSTTTSSSTLARLIFVRSNVPAMQCSSQRRIQHDERQLMQELMDNAGTPIQVVHLPPKQGKFVEEPYASAQRQVSKLALGGFATSLPGMSESDWLGHFINVFSETRSEAFYQAFAATEEEEE